MSASLPVRDDRAERVGGQFGNEALMESGGLTETDLPHRVCDAG
jgi:hypothetical protein